MEFLGKAFGGERRRRGEERRGEERRGEERVLDGAFDEGLLFLIDVKSQKSPGATEASLWSDLHRTGGLR